MLQTSNETESWFTSFELCFSLFTGSIAVERFSSASFGSSLLPLLLAFSLFSFDMVSEHILWYLHLHSYSFLYSFSFVVLIPQRSFLREGWPKLIRFSHIFNTGNTFDNISSPYFLHQRDFLATPPTASNRLWKLPQLLYEWL